MADNFFGIGFAYFITQIFIKGLSFVLIPLYSRYLGPSIYGELAIVDLILGIFGIFVNYRIYAGCYRFYSEIKKEKMFFTALIFSLASAIFQGICIYILYYWIYDKFMLLEYSPYLILIIWIRASIQEVIVLLKTEYSMEYLVKKIFIMNLVTTILTFSLVIYFITVKKIGVIGIYYGYILGNLPILLFLLTDNRRLFSSSFDIVIFKKLFRYGFGLIFGDISYILLAMIDRFFLKIYKNLSDVGIYSLGYKFGGLIEIFFIYSFIEVFNPFKFKNYNKENFEKNINKFYFYYHLIGVSFIMVISLNIKLILYLFTTEVFLSSYRIVPLIAYSYLLYGQSNFYKTGLQLKNKTSIDSITIFCGCIINIILNFLLVKSIGMMGAALSTIASYFIMNIIYYKISNLYLKIRYQKKQMYLIILLSIIIYFIYYVVSISYIDILKQTIYANLLLVIYFVLTWFFIINLEQKKEIICYLKNILLKLKIK